MTATAIRLDKGLAALLLLCLLLMTSAAASVSATTEAASRTVSVIVQSLIGAPAAADAVEEAGGRVVRTLPIVDGVSARVPADSLGALRSDERIWQVTRNGKIGFEQTTPTDFSLTPARIGKITRSDTLWDQGVTGRGVTVALIDTGVYDHPDLAGRVVHCEDFSHEANTEAHCQDTFGHGTFMAGLIAGNGASSSGRFKGTAPEVNLVSVKLSGFDGATDVSNVLAGLQWVVAHRNTYGIDVVNLSLGSDSAQSYRLSPLNYAVERAWKAGITVVVSAGNSGSGSRTILKPADDPLVITVGSSDDENSTPVADDQVAVFSSRGPTRADGLAKPDVVAPGVHTVSLRSPGSAIDQNFGANAVVQDQYFRGTGTSMSAAVVTGIVAQILQANPSLSPDQVKNRVMSTARTIKTTDKYAVGKGEVDAYAATRSTSTAKANGGLLLGLSTGLGSLQASRGSLQLDVTTPAGTGLLSGEVTAQFDLNLLSLQNILGLVPYSGLTYTTIGWDPLSWNGVQWRNNEWAGVQWRGVQWRATEWDGVQWRGVQWRNTDWEGVQWRDADWSGVQWRATNYMSHWYAAAWD